MYLPFFIIFFYQKGPGNVVVNARWVDYQGFPFKFLVVIVFFCECLEGSGDCGDGRPMGHFNFLVVFVFVFFCICCTGVRGMWWWTFSESSNWGLKTGGGSPLPTGQYQAERGEGGFCFGIPISICSLLFFAHLKIKRKCGSQRPPG